MVVLFLIWIKCCPYVFFIVIMINLFFKSMELNSMCKDVLIDGTMVPSVFVDENLLPNKWLYTQENSAYQVNGEIFFLKEDNSNEYFSFEVISDSESLAEDEDANAALPISIQKTRYGIIINSSILLTTDHWNTIIHQDDYAWCCVCCNIVEDSTSHVENEEHIQNMEKYLPLERFDLNIVRAINDKYHCGVCNESFEIESECEHFNSKDHEIKQLSAINRSSDVLYDFDICGDRIQKDSYHFNQGIETCMSDDTSYTDNVESVSCDTDYIGSYMDLNENDVFYDVDFECKQPISGVSYASVAASAPNQLIINWFGTTYKIKYDSWNMVIVVKLEYYCMACKKYGEIAQKTDHCKDKRHIERLQQCQPVIQFKDFVIRKVDDKFYHCGNCNNLQLTHLISDHIERVHNRKVTSIANKTEKVLKKPKEKRATLPKTISSIKNNAKDDEVKDTLDKSDRGIVGKTENSDYVNTRSAVETESSSNGNRNDVTQNLTLPVNDKSDNGYLTLPENDKFTCGNLTLPVNDNSGSVNHLNRNTVTIDLQKVIMIHQFGFNIRVTLLAYNLVWQHFNRYYCGVCNVSLEEACVMQHLETAGHVQMLTQIYFIPVLGINLMRVVSLKNALNSQPGMLVAVHCTICNHPMINDKWVLNTHVLDYRHVTLLNMALSVGLLNQPPHLPQIVHCDRNSEIVPNPVANKADSSQINIAGNVATQNLNHENLRSQTSSVDLNQEKVDNQTKVGLQKVKVDNQTKVDIHQEQIDNQTKFGLHQAKIDDETKVCLHNEKVDNQTVDSTNDQVCNQAKVSTHNSDIVSNLEELIFVKLKNNFIKITFGSLNALVHIGNGCRYCFLCSLTVLALNEHIESEFHLENMKECKFIDKFDKNLIRQNSQMYHCSICNIMISKKNIQKHLSWTLHMKSDSLKNTKRHPDSSDTKTFKISLAKEIHINHKDDLKGPRVLANYAFETGNTVESVAKKNKIIIENGNALKLTWDAWQGVCKNKNGYRCILCKCDFKNYELNSHVSLGKHLHSLERFEIKYLPAFIRKVDDTTLNCVTCNSGVLNKEHIILDHIKGKKHLKHHDDVRHSSSKMNTDVGCNDDVFTIE